MTRINQIGLDNKTSALLANKLNELLGVWMYSAYLKNHN